MTQTDDRSGTKRTSSSRTASKQGSAKKTPAKKAPARKTTAKKSASADDAGSAGSTASKRTAATTQPRRRPSGRQVAAEAARQLVELTGKEPEGIVGLERTEDGWTVLVEVLELRRVPSTTDVLATYAVAMDERAELEGYQRRARYVRGVPGED